MFCKWCGMDSATTDRCSWCSGVLAAETKGTEPETPGVLQSASGTLEENARTENAIGGSQPVKRVPAPPVGGMRRTPAPPVPPRSLRTETPQTPDPPPFAAPLAGFAPESAVSEPTAAFMAPLVTETPTAASEPTVTGSPEPFAEPGAEPEEEVGGLAAGQAKPVEKATVPTAESQMFSANAGAPMSKYYPGKTIEETTGIGANDYIPPPAPEVAAKPKYTKKKTEPDLHIEWEQPEVSSAAVWGKFAAALAGILAVSGALALATRPSILIPLLIANFAGSIMIPVLRVGPWQDEESEDSIFLFILTLIFGPFISLTIYGVMSAVKQMTNPAVLGIMIVAAVTRVALGAISGPFTISMMTPFQAGRFDPVLLLLQWGGLAGMAGWVFANFFHKLHE